MDGSAVTLGVLTYGKEILKDRSSVLSDVDLVV